MSLHADCLRQVELGRLPEAKKLALQGLSRSSGKEKAHFHLALAWIELDRGRPAASTKHLDAAFPHLTGNDLARARCLRGLHLCQNADPRLAIPHLTAVIRDLRRHGDHRWLANALIGRGIARAYTLRLAEADADFTTARTALLSIDEPDRAAMCLHNKGFVAMLAGDPPTALRHYEQAAHDGLAAVHRPEALIDRAQALLAAGLVREAREVLTPAITLLNRCDRGSRIPDAVLLAARCALADNDFRHARTLADQVTGWVAKSVSLRARLALGERPRIHRAATECDRLGKCEDAAELRLAAGHPLDIRRGTARLRALGHLDAARRAPTRSRAANACRAGLALVDPTTWPGTELRAIALGHAIADNDARSVLRWSRATSPGPAPVTTQSAELRLARLQGDDDRVIALEREIRRLALTARPTPASPTTPTTTRLAFTEHDGHLVAVTVIDNRHRLHRVPRLDHHVHALRLAIESDRAHATRVAAEALDALLPPTGTGPITITGSPVGLPWAALPSFRGRPVSLGSTPPAVALRTSAWIAGPALAHATREISALHRAHGGTAVTGGSATVDAALRAMDGVDVVHLAAHGHTRGLFSSLQLADGHLHAHDLDRLSRPPHVVVLSSCDSELAPAFLRRGAGAVIASTLAVPDDRTPALMAAVHVGLRAGLGPAAALARAQLERGDRAFTCFGAG